MPGGQARGGVKAGRQGRAGGNAQQSSQAIRWSTEDAVVRGDPSTANKGGHHYIQRHVMCAVYRHKPPRLYPAIKHALGLVTKSPPTPTPPLALLMFAAAAAAAATPTAAAAAACCYASPRAMSSAICSLLRGSSVTLLLCTSLNRLPRGMNCVTMASWLGCGGRGTGTGTGRQGGRCRVAVVVVVDSRGVAATQGSGFGLKAEIHATTCREGLTALVTHDMCLRQQAWARCSPSHWHCELCCLQVVHAAPPASTQRCTYPGPPPFPLLPPLPPALPQRCTHADTPSSHLHDCAHEEHNVGVPQSSHNVHLIFELL